MEVLPYHYYQLIMRAGNSQRVGHCFGLMVQELSPEEASQYESVTDKDSRAPTHIIVFYDFEHFRNYSGWIKEDSGENLIFELGGGKEYEFRPIAIPQP